MDWEDADHFSLVGLPKGQEVRLQLDSAETKLLCEHLERLMALAKKRLPRGESTYRVVSKMATVLSPAVAGAITDLLGLHDSEELADAIARTAPDLVRRIAFNEQQEHREQVLRTFEEELSAARWDEYAWQNFFEHEEWLLGFGAAHQFLGSVASHPYTSSQSIRGKGVGKGDLLLATAAAQARFTVLVELKRPNSSPLQQKAYREAAGVFAASGDLAGGIAQVQTACNTFEEEARRAINVRDLESDGIYTYRPKGVLVIGNTGELDSDGKLRSFELFRREIVNPDIITYDELLERARVIVGASSPIIEDDDKWWPGGPQ